MHNQPDKSKASGSSNLNDGDLKKRLTAEQYNVCILKGTESPFSGKYTNNKTEGTYECVVCGQVIFSSDAKYDSGSGWPSFFDPMNNKAIELKEDVSAGMVRTEVVCSKCKSHLGHVFDDGPPPTGKRYRINSIAMAFKEKKK